MRALVCADLHIASKHLDRGIELLRQLKDLANLNNLDAIFVLGDFLDEKDKHSLSLSLAVHKMLKSIKAEKMPLYWIRGNHELPYANRPNHSIIHMFSEVCHVVSTPQIVSGKDYSLYLLPWFPADKFITAAKTLSRSTYESTGKNRFLLAHVGLDQTKVNTSDLRISSGVGLKDLCLDNYHLCLLGDIHLHQQVAKNCYYLGAPISHHFGDEHQNRVWVLDTDLRAIEPLPLLTEFPKYATYQVDDPSHPIVGFNPQDFNRIECHANLRAALSIRYGKEVVFKTTGNTIPEVARRVLAGATEEDILKEYLTPRNWMSTHYDLAVKYLNQAKDRMSI